jgi:protein-tyrosine phosphatase
MIIDFHAHILPGLDHGCKDLTTAVTQLKMAKKAGIDVVVATSHFYPSGFSRAEKGRGNF